MPHFGKFYVKRFSMRDLAFLSFHVWFFFNLYCLLPLKQSLGFFESKRLIEENSDL